MEVRWNRYHLVGQVALPIGWAFAWWGVLLYWLAAVLYAVQARRILASRGTMPSGD